MLFESAMAAVIRRADPDWTPADQAELERWCHADPRHAAALHRAEALWGRFEGMAPAWDRVEQRRGPSRRAVLSGLAGLGGLALVGRHLSAPGGFADYRTAAGELRAVALPDGSEVELGTRSALSLGPTARQAALDLGEAVFRVRPAAAPFDATALGLQVQAPPAQAASFALRAIRDRGQVAAIEGELMLIEGHGRTTRMPPGTEVRFTAQGIGRPMVSAPGTVAPWRQGRLVFDDAPLAEVVAELGRYRAGRVVTDPRIGAMRLTAVFDTHDIAGAFASIAQTLPVQVIDTRLALLVMAG